MQLTKEKGLKTQTRFSSIAQPVQLAIHLLEGFEYHVGACLCVCAYLGYDLVGQIVGDNEGDYGGLGRGRGIGHWVITKVWFFGGIRSGDIGWIRLYNGASASCAQRAHALQGKTSGTCSWLHSLQWLERPSNPGRCIKWELL